MQRLSVWFSGRVQGVGFRATVVSIARKFEVAGRVRNLPDGRVEMEAEGKKEELVRFREAICEAMKDKISGYDEQWSASAGNWVGFQLHA